MRSKLALVAFVTALCWSSSARADSGARIVLIDMSRLYSANGVSEWAAARAKLDAERSTFVVVEVPEGGTSPDDKYYSPKDLPGLRRQRAWEAHEKAILDPIRARVVLALAQYAKRRGIELVLDRSTLLSVAIVVAAPSIDITDAFLKDLDAATKRQKAR